MTRPELAGYWPSPWPCEDGGPTRQQTLPAAAGLAFAGASPTVTSRTVFGANMTVLRDPGEVFLQGNTLGGPDTTAWVERIDPTTLEPKLRSPDLAGGPFWAGGIAAHRNGSLYVTYGRWCHRLDADTLEPIASTELPRARPYNSLLILPDGNLVMKDFCGGTGAHAITNSDTGSQLVVLEPDRLAVIAELELPEGSIARLTATAEPTAAAATLHVVGDQSLHTIGWNPTTRQLTERHAARRYLTQDGQTFGWDAVIADGSAWFLDNGEGTATFGPSFRGKGVSTAPLHLIRFDLADPAAPPTYTEVCGQPGGIIANTPLIDPVRKIAVGYDSGNGVLAAWHYPQEASAPLVPLWQRDQHHAGHMLLDVDGGRFLTFDYDHDDGQDHATIVDVATGDVIERIATGSPVQTVLFPSPGWNDDAYVVSFTTIARISRS